MNHNPITIRRIALSFPHKECFTGFSTTVHYGDRIAVIGNNGAGKSSLLRMLSSEREPTEGSIDIPKNAVIAYVPQIIQEHEEKSGGQRFNAALSKALALDPNVLLLDEPTNHLDYKNRQSLMRKLRSYEGTLIIVSHDPELLRNCVDSLWHIDREKITVYNGSYDEYRRQLEVTKADLERQLSALDRSKKAAHTALMREQERAKKSKVSGQKRYAGDTLTLSTMQARGERSTNKRQRDIQADKQATLDKLSSLYQHEVLTPKFSLDTEHIGTKNVLSITQGSCGYRQPVLHDIFLTVGPDERVAILGDNGSGKSTLFKAILRNPTVIMIGEWHLPPLDRIGYLDQHYGALDPDATPLELMRKAAPGLNEAEIRKHLNNYLFRKNEEVNAPTRQLSGGERARLSLALIGAKTPRLLLLDEITNNIDLETREHVIEVIRDYPGALMVISHDKDFLQAIGIDSSYDVIDGKLVGTTLQE